MSESIFCWIVPNKKLLSLMYLKVNTIFLFSKKQFEIWIEGEKNQILFQRSFVLIKKHFVSSTFCFLQWASSGRGSFPPLPGKIVLFLTSWEKSYFFNGFIQIYAFIITLPRKFFHPLKNSLLQPTSWSSQTSW